MTNITNAVWSIKYRPSNFDDIVLPESAKAFFKQMVDSNNYMNMLLSGPPGIGKTTAARALVKEANGEMLFLNASGKDRGIDVVKNKLSMFAQTMSIEQRPKFVLYDEADSLTHDAQLALRATIEEFDKTKFILTCNFPGRLIEPLLSRFEHVRFSGDREANELKKQMAIYLTKILDNEDVKYSKKAIMQIVQLTYPDFRQTISSLQSIAIKHGEIADEAIAELKQTSSSGLFDIIMQKKFREMIDWVMANVSDPDGFAASIWPVLGKRITEDTYPYAVVFMNDVQTQLPIVADKHLALIAGLTKIMLECEVLQEQ